MSDNEEIEKSVDCVTDQEREHAQNALCEFNKLNYVNCLQYINKLDNRTFDFKVAHNKAVVEYHKADLKKTEHFQKNLNNIFHQYHMTIKKLDDVDHCVAHFNQAVVLYHQGQYTASLRIIDRVYKFIEPMDDYLSKQVGLLMIELQLCIRQPDKALGFITYLQNQLVNGNNGSMKIALKHPKQSDRDQKEAKSLPPLSPSTMLFLKKLAKYRIRCYLMNHSLNVAKEEIEQLINQDRQNIENLFLLANHEYLLGNFQESMKILMSIPNECLSYNECGESSTVMFYNNMGVIHYALGKPNLACHYFQRALKEDISSKPTDNVTLGDKPLYMLGSSRYSELMYNLGISLLCAGHPVQAFECLVVAVRRYHRNSRLWLRLAECCILTHKESNEIDFDIKRKQKEFVVHYFGANEKQRIVLNSNLSKDMRYSTESQSYAVPVPTLEFASLCLRNAHILLPSDTVSSPVPLLLIPGVTPPAPPPSPGPAPSTPLCIDGIATLKNAILAASAYVSLCLGDYILTLEYAETLLKQPRKSGIHVLLGHLYAAEALVLLDKISDALEHLNPENIQNISFELPPEDEPSEELPLKTNPPFKWFPTTTASALAVVQYNIAVAKTVRGQLDQAATILKQIWQSKGSNCQVPAHIIMLVLYIELQLGHADVARSLIKQYSLQHRFVG